MLLVFVPGPGFAIVIYTEGHVFLFYIDDVVCYVSITRIPLFEKVWCSIRAMLCVFKVA